jgi:glucoside 3-dehydrogenase (cytochrome c) hitch-hiker subunit
MTERDGEFSRREVLKIGAAATVAASLGLGESVASQVPAAAAAKFFTPEELALVDELSEMIIPTDAKSPGAKAAKVAAFIDSQLAEAFDEKDRTEWRAGLARIDRLAADMRGQPFLRSSEADRTAILTRVAQNEAAPKSPDELFFKELKERVVHAYYTSEIGIKQDMEYKGNTYLPEFVGYDVSAPERKSPA